MSEQFWPDELWDQCRSYMLTGGRCDLEQGHKGPHQKQYPSRLATWTDESQSVDRYLSRFD